MGLFRAETLVAVLVVVKFEQGVVDQVRHHGDLHPQHKSKVTQALVGHREGILPLSTRTRCHGSNNGCGSWDVEMRHSVDDVQRARVLLVSVVRGNPTGSLDGLAPMLPVVLNSADCTWGSTAYIDVGQPPFIGQPLSATPLLVQPPEPARWNCLARQAWRAERYRWSARTFELTNGRMLAPRKADSPSVLRKDQDSQRSQRCPG